MKTPSFFEPGKEPFFDTTLPSNEQACYGKQQFVNFSSTEEVFHAVFENLCHANTIGNGHGKTLEANEAVCKIFGYTNDEMTRLTAKELFDTVESNYVEYLSERELTGKAKAEITGIRKNGQRFLCDVSSVIFTNDKGETRTINTIHDISKKYDYELFEL